MRTWLVIASSDTQKAPCIFQLLSDEPSLSSVLHSQASVKESVQKVPEEESAEKYEGPKRRPESGECEPIKKFKSETDLVKSQEYTQTFCSRVCRV